MLIKKQTPASVNLFGGGSPFSWNPFGSWDQSFGNFFSELEPTCWDQAESEDSVTVSLVVPGFKQEELDIEVHHRGFSVKGKSTVYSRSYAIDRTLGCKIVPDSTQAILENGILTLTFKKESARKTEAVIKVKAHSPNELAG